MPEGSIQTFIPLLVALERTIDPVNLTVYPWRPISMEAPAIYNWLLPSPSEIPATQTVVDTMNFAVRVVMKPSDLDEEMDSAASYFDQVRDVIDADLINPSVSTLRTACHKAKRTTTRALTDTFNDIPYMALELVIEAQFRRQFQPAA